MSNQYKRNKRELLKDKCLQYLGGKRCAICGIDWLPAYCYDFHHRLGAKNENISEMIARKKDIDAELKAELDKCLIGCSNCHRIITKRTMPLETIKTLYLR